MLLEHSAILLTALSDNQSFGFLFEWPLKTGFTVHASFTTPLHGRFNEN